MPDDAQGRAEALAALICAHASVPQVRLQVDPDELWTSVRADIVCVHPDVLELDDASLAGCLAHEVAHLHHQHAQAQEGVRLLSIVAALSVACVTAVVAAPAGGAVVLAAGLLALPVGLKAVSRHHELQADATAARMLSGLGFAGPDSVAAALNAVAQARTLVPSRTPERPPGVRSLLRRFRAEHPALDVRIARLAQMR